MLPDLGYPEYITVATSVKWICQRLEVDPVLDYQGGNADAARSDAEREAFEAAPNPASEAGFFLHLLREYDRDIRSHIVVGNDRPEILEKLLFNEHTLPGFNDSGA